MTDQDDIPRAAALAFNAANAAFRNNDFSAALEQAGKALNEMPRFALAHLMRARSLKAMGDLRDAAAAYEAVLEAEPDNFNAHLELGNIRRQQGSLDDAAKCYSKAIASRPQDHRGYLAAALLHAGDTGSQSLDICAGHYHRALTAVGSDLTQVQSIHFEMGRARLVAGQAGLALEALRQAWMTRCLDKSRQQGSDEDAPLLCEMARSYLRLGLEADARKVLERAARATDATTLRDVAVICYEANFWEDGIAVLRRAVNLHPKDVDTHLALADMLSRCWKLEEARKSLQAAEKTAPIAPATKNQLLGKIASSQGEVEEALIHYRALVDLGIQSAASSVAMTSLYSAEMTAANVSKLHKNLFASFGNGARQLVSFPNTLDADRPLRIGMVTADLHRQHPVNLFMQPLLRRWPQADLPLTIYFTGNSYDAQTRLAKERAGQWREVTYEGLAAQVIKDQIDILIDLAGHTSHRAMVSFARRMAPVQVSYLGYPGSTGVPNIDWLIADRIVAPEGHADQFSERLMHMPHTVFCFAPEAVHPIPEPTEEVASRPLTFGSFNNVPKLTPDTIALWARAMAAVPDSRMMLKAPSFQDPGVVSRYRDLFAGQGIIHDRLEFRGPTALDEMMQEYAEIDVALDPIHYGGGTTTLQAMWMGVPVLTMKGDKFASRMGASFMQAGGLDEFVAHSSEEFVQQAKAVAADRAALVSLKQGMRDHLLQRPAWDADLFARDFATCLRNIWKQSLGGLRQGKAQYVG